MDTSRPRYLHMFLVFVKIGLFTIGGGPAMIPLIRDEFVEKQKWIRDEDITDVLALSQSLPGVIAVNASTFLGYRLGGLKGSLVATIGSSCLLLSLFSSSSRLSPPVVLTSTPIY